MSRVSEYEDDSDFPALDQGRWERNSRAVLRSKRGQQALRELEAALLALPAPRLIADEFCRVDLIGDGPVAVERGDVCVLGALALHQGHPVERLADLSPDLYNDIETSLWAKHHLGLRRTLAYILIEWNDEGAWRRTQEQPEERFTRVLAFVRDHLETAIETRR